MSTWTFCPAAIPRPAAMAAAPPFSSRRRSPSPLLPTAWGIGRACTANQGAGTGCTVSLRIAAEPAAAAAIRAAARRRGGVDAPLREPRHHAEVERRLVHECRAQCPLHVPSVRRAAVRLERALHQLACPCSRTYAPPQRRPGVFSRTGSLEGPP